MRLAFRKRQAVRPELAEADRLEAEGRRLEAIELLTQANRTERSGELEERLVVLRHRAFAELGGEGGARVPAEAVEPGGAAEDDGMPAVAADQLTAARIAGAFASHGALIVRGLVDPASAKQVAAGIDRTFGAKAAADSGAEVSETSPWFRPFVPDDEAAQGVAAYGRAFLSDSGVWTADSPRMLFELLETFEAAGMREIVGDYLGGRAALSLNKGTLRRAQPTVGTAWWHQDGAFLGEHVRSLNVWLSLSHCGVDAPGMELVPQRLDGIVEKGTRGADFDWSVGEEVVAKITGKTAKPIFAPGDALLFDHLNLHRTSVDASMTATRYATETWFFAPAAYPDPVEQVPLAF